MFIRITERSDSTVALVAVDTIDYIEPNKNGDVTVYYKDGSTNSKVLEPLSYFEDKLVVK